MFAGPLLEIASKRIPYWQLPNHFTDCWTELVRVLHCPLLWWLSENCLFLWDSACTITPSNLDCPLSSPAAGTSKDTLPLQHVPSFPKDSWRTLKRGPSNNSASWWGHTEGEWWDSLWPTFILVTKHWPYYSSFKELWASLSVYTTVLTLCCSARLAPLSALLSSSLSHWVQDYKYLHT